MNNQRILEHQLVDELRKNGDLDEVIFGYCYGVRLCGHCQKLMNEGWMYDGRESYCSDKCLLAEYPNEDISDLRKHASDDDSETYWTKWEV